MSTSTITDRIRTLLDNMPPLDRLPDEARADILTDVSIEYYNPGEVILEQGSMSIKGLYIVESGMVRLMDLDNQRLIDKCGEGDFFGAFNLMRGGSALYEAKAVEPTVCALLKGERFQQLCTQYPDFATFFESDVKQYVRHIDKTLDVTGAHLLFSRRLNQFVHRDPVTCGPDMTAQQAARLMRREGVDSLLVMQDGRLVGIMTDSDLRNKLVAVGKPADLAVRRLMSAPVLTVSAEAPLFEAMMLMIQHHVNRLVLTEGEGPGATPVGLLTDRDLAHFRGHDPVATVARIQRAPSVSELVSIRTETSEQLLRLYRQGVQPEMIGRIMSALYDDLVIRMLELAEADLRSKSPQLRVDLPWVWLRLGSGGRREMALNSQQHNALLYANPSSDEEAERAEQWFNRLAGQVNAGLASCGFEMSEIVAGDPRWRKSLRQWKQAYRTWILQADASALTHVPLFFDLRGIYGKMSLVDELKRDIVDALNIEAMDADRKFLTLMSANALEHRPPLSFFRRFVVARSGEHRNTFDIRERGILPLVDAARVLALELRYLDSTSTFDRLRYAAAEMPDLSKTLEAALEAYRQLVDYRLEEQLRAFEAGEPPNNRIDPLTLRKVQQNLLRSTFNMVAEVQEALARHHEVTRRRLERPRGGG